MYLSQVPKSIASRNHRKIHGKEGGLRFLEKKIEQSQVVPDEKKRHCQTNSTVENLLSQTTTHNTLSILSSIAKNVPETAVPEPTVPESKEPEAKVPETKDTAMIQVNDPNPVADREEFQAPTHIFDPNHIPEKDGFYLGEFRIPFRLYMAGTGKGLPTMTEFFFLHMHQLFFRVFDSVWEGTPVLIKLLAMWEENAGWHPERKHPEFQGFMECWENEPAWRRGNAYHACHPNILPIAGFLHDDKQEVLGMVQTLPGTKRRTLHNIFEQGADRNALKLAYDVACALTHMHQLNLPHGNIRPEEVYVDDSGEKAFLDSYNLLRLHESAHMSNYGKFKVLSLRYHPADRIKDNYTILPATLAADVYSFGVLLYSLLISGTKFADAMKSKSDFVQLRKDPHAEYRNISGQYSFINECCALDPSDRPKIENVLERLENLLYPSSNNAR